MKNKTTTSDSEGTYFKHNRKPKLPDDIEEETEKQKFMKKYGEVLEI